MDAGHKGKLGLSHLLINTIHRRIRAKKMITFYRHTNWDSAKLKRKKINQYPIIKLMEQLKGLPLMYNVWNSDPEKGKALTNSTHCFHLWIGWWVHCIIPIQHAGR